jgi:hypothetical protein
MNSSDYSPEPASQSSRETPIFLRVITGDNCPSFKNRKRMGRTPKAIKQRMLQLENRIVSALYSLSEMPPSATALEWPKQLRTALSGLSDDSLTEIPEFSFGVRFVEPGCEGVEITIEKL